jgi:hypothetical protein
LPGGEMPYDPTTERRVHQMRYEVIKEQMARL